MEREVVHMKAAEMKDSQEERRVDKQGVQQERDWSIVVRMPEEYQSEQVPMLGVAVLLLGGCAT